MLYSLLKIPAKLAFLIWCRHLRINKKEILNAEGPLLIAANHPNSFLDAILLATIFKSPVYSLARGDAFKNKFIEKILRALKMFPVYRISEGAENLEENYSTFDECIKVFRKNGIVLIFSEGACVNEWYLRPLKKGTARLVLKAWEQDISLKILPTGINYSSFSRFGKNVILNFGEIMSREHFGLLSTENEGQKIQRINTALKIRLDIIVLKINPSEKRKLKETFEVPVNKTKEMLLFIPALLGWLLHAPLYISMQKFAYKKFRLTGHYNSVLLGLLFFSYPVYLVLIALALYFFAGGWWWAVVCTAMPLMAWCSVQVKK